MPPKKKAKLEPAVATAVTALAAFPKAIWQYSSDTVDPTTGRPLWIEMTDPAEVAVLEKALGAKNPSVTLPSGALAAFHATGDWELTLPAAVGSDATAPLAAKAVVRRLTPGVWEWKDDAGLFVAFYDEDNAVIESAWRVLAHPSLAWTAAFVTTKLSWNVGFDSKYTFTFGRNAAGEITGVQKNEDSGTERVIHRIPHDIATAVWDMSHGFGIAGVAAPTIESVKAVAVAAAAEAEGTAPPPAVDLSIFDVPSYWAPQTTTNERFRLKEDSEEFKKATETFLKTLNQAKCKIHWVERIQNTTLWRFYALSRYRVATRNKGNANEMNLFHGARVRENMQAIENYGFDMRVARSGSVGIGIYFAVNSSYSNGGYVLRNPDNSREMFVCRVAVGDHVQGKHGLKRPPVRQSKKAKKAAGAVGIEAEHEDLYDAVHNGKPISMYVVFDNSQAYPEYVIKYTPQF